MWLWQEFFRFDELYRAMFWLQKYSITTPCHSFVRKWSRNVFLLKLETGIETYYIIWCHASTSSHVINTFQWTSFWDLNGNFPKWHSKRKQTFWTKYILIEVIENCWEVVEVKRCQTPFNIWWSKTSDKQNKRGMRKSKMSGPNMLSCIIQSALPSEVCSCNTVHFPDMVSLRKDLHIVIKGGENSLFYQQSTLGRYGKRPTERQLVDWGMVINSI